MAIDCHPGSVTLALEMLSAWRQAAWFDVIGAVAILAVAWLCHRLRLRQLTRRLAWQLDTQTLERERIARELHDTLLQSFYGLLMQFYSVAEKMPEADPERHHLSQVLARADQALLEGRESVHNLRGLSQENLAPAQIVALARLEIDADAQAALHVSASGVEVELHPVVVEHLIGVLREGLRNAFRHAGADNIRVQFVYTRALFRLILEDDGRGIVPEVLRDGRARHWGLPGMRERVKRIGGQVEISSKLGRGTKIELRLRAALAYRRPEGLASRFLQMRKRLRLHGLHADAVD